MPMLPLDSLVMRAARAAAADRLHVPGWRAVAAGEYAPSTFAAVVHEARYARATFQPFRVYGGGSERTIYGSPAVNHAFRFWHDAVHFELGADFSPAGEARVAYAQLREARALGAGREALRMLRADTLGQVWYFAHHGRFVEDQREFVRLYCAGALDSALAVL